MKRPSKKSLIRKFQTILIRQGHLNKSVHGIHKTPGGEKHLRQLWKEDFGLSPLYFSKINSRSLLNTIKKFYRKGGYTGALGMDWLKHVR